MNRSTKIILKIACITVFTFIFLVLKPTQILAAEITIDGSVNASNESQKGRNLVWTTPTTGYFFYVDVTTNDLVYVKTTTGGRTWGSTVNINTGSVTKVSVWYDKWTTGDTGTKIHIAYIETGAIDAMYRDLDTNGDTLGADTIAINLSGGTGSWLYSESEISITKARGGNLYIAAASTAGTSGFYRCTGTCNTGSNWTSRAAVFEASVTDGVILMPGGESDNQDILALYWDYSADEISLKTYDDSGNSVAETSISTGMVENTTYGVQWSAVQRQSDNHVILAAWNALNSSTADLKMWEITNSSSITAKTDIITNQAETANISLMINQSDDTIYAAYLQGSAFTATVDAVYKLSVSGGATWSAQARFSVTNDDLRYIDAGTSIKYDTGRFQPVWYNDDLDDMVTSYAYIWDGGGGDTNWNTAANWLTDTAPSTSTDWLVFSAVSSKSATLNTSPNIGGIHILPWYSGTITQASTNTITLSNLGYSQNSGVFSGGSGSISLNTPADYSLSGGNFTATSGTLLFAGDFTVAGGIFTHNSGTVTIQPANQDYIYINATISLHNLIAGDSCYTNPTGIEVTTGTISVSNLLTLNDTCLSGSLGFIGPGSIEMTGNADVSVIGGGAGQFRGINGSTSFEIKFSGTGTQTITSEADTDTYFPGIDIAKTGGSLTFVDTIITTADWINTSTNTVITTTGSTVIFDPITNTSRYITGSITLNDATFSSCSNPGDYNFASGTTLTVVGTLTLEEACGEFRLYGPGAIEAQGNVVTVAGGDVTGDIPITFSGTANQTITHNASSFPTGTVTINKSSGTVTLATSFSINSSGQDMVISAGTLNLAGFSLTVNDQFTLGATGTLKLQGGETTVSTLDTITSGGTVEYNGTGTYSSLKMGNSYSNLTISGSGSFTPASNVTVGLDFSQSAGTFNVAPSGMTVSRNFTRTGGSFVPGSSTVTFDNSGYTSSISGTTTFYNLTSITPSKTLRFASNSDTTVSNALTLRGSTNGLLNLESTDTGYPWRFIVNGTATLSYLDVSDSNACNGSTKPLTTTGSLDGGNNYCWSISGGFLDWYNSSWTQRRALRINSSMVSGAHNDFPVLIKLSSDSGLATYAQNDGDDILITSEDGTTKLSHELEKFDEATGELWLWVKIPYLSSSADTRLFMYYGNASATNQQSVTSTWESNYRAVYHLNQTSGTSITDSTSNSNTGAKRASNGPNPISTGQLDGAQDFESSTSDYIRINDANSLDITTAGTISVWMKNESTSGFPTLVHKGDTADELGNYGCWIDHGAGSPVHCFVSNGSTTNNLERGAITGTSSWYYVVFTWDGNNLRIYVNGTQSGAAASQTITPTATTHTLRIGEYGGAVDYFDGIYDEVRLSGTTRSADWILTEYNNQKFPDSFVTVSTDSTQPVTNIRGGVKINSGTRIGN